MIRNYLVVAWRNLKSNLVFSTLNAIGLSIGMACCLVVFLFAYQEYTYDTHHEKAGRIYRVVNRQSEGAKLSYVALTQGVLAPELLKNFAEIEAATRVSFMNVNMVVANSEPLSERVMTVDPSYFKIFTIPFKQSRAGYKLSTDDILISQRAATRLFGKKNPIGETISLDDIHLKVAGVFENFTMKSHLMADYIISFAWVEKTDAHAQSWNFNSYYNYVLVPEDFDKSAFDKKMNAFIHRFTPESWKAYEYFLQPIRSINLQAGYVGNPRGTVGKVLVNGFVTVGVIILLLASFNYMNMATARSARRAIEVGIRKVVGARRSQLIGQFLTESFILCSAGFILAILWADLAIQFFNHYTGFELQLQTFFVKAELVGWLIGALIFIAIVSGSYPAFFLSRYLPITVLKGQRSSDSGNRLRKGLVVFQFMLTSTLVVLVIIVNKQISYMRSLDVGYNKEQLLLFSADRNKEVSAQSFKAELLKITGVKQVTVTSSFPGGRVSATSIWEHGKGEQESIKSQWVFADEDYLPTLELKLLSGRNFNSNGSDENRGMIITERTATSLGWLPEEAVGKHISGFVFTDSLPGEIIGVVKDFHVSAIRKEMMPLVISYTTERSGYMVRLEGNQLFQTRAAVDKAVKRMAHGDDAESTFMEDALEESYGAENKSSEMLVFFTFLAILIGCSGLYALSAYEGDQRIKELGVRKIMGATSSQLLFLLSRDFLKLIVIALMLALPLAYWMSGYWLQTYAYRISWTIDIFLGAAMLILLLGWLTILSQAWKASRLNPVDALRYE